MADTTRNSRDGAERGPEVGATLIDDVRATSVVFRREGAEDRYAMTFRDGTKTIAELTNLDAVDVDTALGERNAARVLSAPEGRGILVGADLANAYGLSPAEQGRRIIEKEERKMRDMQGRAVIDGEYVDAVRYQREAPVKAGEDYSYRLTFQHEGKTVSSLKELDAAQVQMAVGEKNAQRMFLGESDKGVLRGETLEWNAGISPKEADQREQATDKAGPVGFEVNAAEGLAYLGQRRDRERTQRDGERERAEAKAEGLADKADTQRNMIENLGERQRENVAESQAVQRSGGEAGSDYMEAKFASDERVRRMALLESVNKQYVTAQNKYFFRDNNKKLAFEDKGQRLVTRERDDRVAHSMATLAEAKGWKTIRVSGHPEFKQQVWLEASMRGIGVQGYKPSDKDLALLKERQERSLTNSVEPGAKGREEPTQGEVASRRKAANRREDWNHDMPQADGAFVVSAVAEALAKANIKNPRTQAAVVAEVNRRMKEGTDRGHAAPTVPMYDKSAPSKTNTPEHVRPQVERNAERTR